MKYKDIFISYNKCHTFELITACNLNFADLLVVAQLTAGLNMVIRLDI